MRFLLLLLCFACAFAARPVKIFMYQYIPDLAGDFYVGLAKKLQDQFFLDTGLNVSLTYSYAYNTYQHTTISDALTTGEYDMCEADATAVPYLADGDYIIPVPNDVDMSGFTEESLDMSKDANGNLYMVPSYSCVNVMFSYDEDLKDQKTADEVVPWIQGKIAGHPEKIGWSGDLSSKWSLRYNYIDGYMDSYPHADMYPDAYSATLDSDIVQTMKDFRDSCVDTLTTPHTNPCMDGTYYNNYGRFFGDLVNGRSAVLQGFPEYLSLILAANSSPVPTITTVPLGDGNKNFVYTNGFVTSKSNCLSDCLSTAVTFMNWQKVNHGLITSLGLDLSPNRPRYLMWSWAPFYDMPAVKAYNQYKTYWKWQKKGIPIETVHILETEAAHHGALHAEITAGYTPP
jgi:hypothetical protein